VHPAGKHQALKGATACEICSPGHFCQEGASSPRPCKQGSYSNATNLTTADECTPANPGFYASTGSVAPTACAAGMVAPTSRLHECLACDPGAYQNESGATECRPCELGSYCPRGASSPLPCNQGSYSNATNLASADECTATGPGFFAPTGSVDQTACAAGTFAPSASQAKCSACAPGNYQDATGATECKPCPEGHSCSEGASAPLPCPAGRHQRHTGQSTCDACESGHACPVGSVNQTACKPGSYAVAWTCELCPGGKYQPSSTLTRCELCPIGSQCNQGATRPTTCAPGTAAPARERATCDKCAAGKHQGMGGMSACTTCDSGSYCAEGAAAPLPCIKGTYSSATNLTAQAECTRCPPGSSCSTGSASPTRCAPGSYSVEHGSFECSTCEDGAFQDSLGTTRCTLCRAGSYSPNVLSCIRCPVNEYCEQGATIGTPCPFALSTTLGGASGLDDCICKAGYYLTNRTCTACPHGADCSTQGTSLETLPLKAGFWRTGNQSEDVRECYTSDACIGSINATSSVCADGHLGPFCERCQPDYYKTSSGRCTRCGGTDMASVVVLCGVFLVFLLGLIRWLCTQDRERLAKIMSAAATGLEEVGRGGGFADAAGATLESASETPGGASASAPAAAPEAADTVQEEESKATTSKLKKLVIAINWRSVGNKSKILISLFQVLSPLSIVYSIVFPPIFDSLLRWLNLAQFNLIDIMPLACIYAVDYHSTLLLRTLLPIAVLFLLYCMRRWCHLKASKARGQDKEYYASLADGCVSFAFLLLFLIYPSTSQNIFYAFQCLKLDDGSSLLRIDLSISCDSTTHKAFMVYAGLMGLAYPIGIPALYALILYLFYPQLKELMRLERSKAVLEQQKADAARTETDSHQAIVQRRQSFKLAAPELARAQAEYAKLEPLFEAQRDALPDYVRKLVGGFEFRVFWFELMECLRKLMLIGAPVFFDPPGSVQQLLYGLVACFIIACAYALWQPYVDDSDDRLALLCQTSIFFALLSSVVNAFDNSLRSSSGMDVLLVTCTVLPVVISVACEVPFGLIREAGKRWVERCGGPRRQRAPPPASASAAGIAIEVSATSAAS